MRLKQGIGIMARVISYIMLQNIAVLSYLSFIYMSVHCTVICNTFSDFSSVMYDPPPHMKKYILIRLSI